MSTPVHPKQAQLQKIFTDRFGNPPGTITVRSPGRINLIGEHTDYNEGFVLPGAIDQGICFIAAPRNDDKINFIAADMDEDFTCTLRSLKKSSQGWPNYLLGVIEQIVKTGRTLRGCDVIFGGDVPIGAGLSSSAAVEAGFAFALNTMFSLNLSPIELVHVAQNAEREFVGVQCGIMDQFINIFGKEKHVLRLDCRTLEYEYFPFDYDHACFVLCDTGVNRQLAASEYNARRSQCKAGVAVLQKDNPAVKSLRDVTPEHLLQYIHILDPLLYKRCEYVVSENARVLSVCKALLSNDLPSVGRLMYESHAGLRDGYEVSCRELDLLVDIAATVPGVYGARMMGAGFGGCTLNLIERRRVADFIQIVNSEYKKTVHRGVPTYVVQIQVGTGCV
jgi:galactokinase